MWLHWVESGQATGLAVLNSQKQFIGRQLYQSVTPVSFNLQTQIQYLKQVQQPSAAQLRSSMVDPAINLFFLKMKAELEQTKDKLEQAQNELSAWKFTPDR